MATSPVQDDTLPVDKTLLFNAINSASTSRLQSVLREICTTKPEAYKLACDLLLIANGDDSNNNSDTTAAPPRPKRKYEALQQRFEICVKCKQEYDVSMNIDGFCMWHSGELESDWNNDFWADHDESSQGQIDTPENRSEYPDGFVWSCCDGFTDDTGCEEGVHEPDLGKMAGSAARG